VTTTEIERYFLVHDKGVLISYVSVLRLWPLIQSKWGANVGNALNSMSARLYSLPYVQVIEGFIFWNLYIQHYFDHATQS